jgi:cell division protein FtsB
MTYALIAVAAVTAVVGAASAYKQGQNTKALAEYQAQNDEVRAQQERINAGAREEDARREARAQLGRQLAGTAESGVQLNGSASDLFRQSLFNAESDAQAVRYEGESRARGLMSDASAERFGGKMAMKSAKISAYGSLATGAAQAYGGYKKGTA